MKLGGYFREILQLPAGTYVLHVLERLLVDLSRASLRMEGNTYSILETERLIQFGEEASGKNRKEAIMIPNTRRPSNTSWTTLRPLRSAEPTFPTFTRCLRTAFSPTPL